jgi:gliding motility-associated-like protein
MQDIHVCITPTEGVDTTITLEIDSWGNGVTYGAGNQFLVQILNSQFYTVLNTGDLGTVTASTNTSLTLTIPNLNDLIALLGPPGYGMYYMRLIPTNASSPSDTLGTLVRLIIGTINPPGDLTANDTVLCPGTIVELYLNPYDWNSTYQWYSPALSNGQPFYWSYNPLLVQFNANTSPQAFWFTVREVNNGCFSPWSDTVIVHVIGTPNVNIQSTSPVCVGDSVHFWVPFLTATYYDWTTSGGTIVKFANNEITVMFDSVGTYTIDVFALNECGSNDGTKTVTVLPRPEVQASPDVIACAGTPVTLSATGTGGTAFSWMAPDSTALSATYTLDVIADSVRTYIVTLASPAGCKDYDTVLVSAFSTSSLLLDVEHITCYGMSDGTATVSATQGTPPYTFVWNTGASGDSLSGLSDGIYSVTSTDGNGCTASTSETILMPPPIGVAVTSTPSVFGQDNGTATAAAIGGTAPFSFTWNTVPEQYTNEITDLGVGTYVVTVVDDEGCTGVGSVDVDYAANVIYIPNAFSPNYDGHNELWEYFAINLESIHIMVFNRWGEKLFETSEPGDYWNGKRNGISVPLGVYVYHVEATFKDGEKRELKGNVTVIR